MSNLKAIITEALDENMLSFKEKLQEELSSRISSVLSDAIQEQYRVKEVTLSQLQKHFDDGNWEAMHDPKPGRHVELRNTRTGKRSTWYVKEEVEDLDEGYTDEQRRNLIRQSHGPLMKAGDWIKKSPLKDLASHPEIARKGSHVTLYVGGIHNAWDNTKKPTPIAILSHDKPDPDSISSGYNHGTVGYNKNHQWYEDTGLGHKFPSSHLRITGHVHIHPDGKIETHGDVDMNKPHNLMVYK